MDNRMEKAVTVVPDGSDFSQVCLAMPDGKVISFFYGDNEEATDLAHHLRRFLASWRKAMRQKGVSDPGPEEGA